jgi:pyruvate dehydrogenase E2 component (dihydrolipoamide acetyltransferase)
MDVESPVDGVVVRWLAEADQLLPIGADVLVVDASGAVDEDAEAMPTAALEPAVPVVESADELFPLAVPHIGEGLQEARIVLLHKQPGDAIARDEYIFQIETDKAVMDIESPVAGVLVDWLASVDQVVPIGAVVGRVAVSGGTAPAAPAEAAVREGSVEEKPSATSVAGGRRRDLPPRTRAHAFAQGLTEADLDHIPATGKNLLPEDVDRFLAARAAPKPAPGKKAFTEAPLPSKQRVLSSRLVRGSQLVVPGMMSISVNWQGIEDLRDEYKASGSDFQPSSFTMFAYAVAKAASEHAVMRSTLVGEGMVRTYDSLQLGIAVALPGDELVVAVVEDSDTLDWRTFAAAAREKIALARAGKDQANETVTLSITNMAGHGIRDAMAVVVPPGVATIFLGEPHWALSNEDPRMPSFMRAANVGITIDHRLINGVGGAEFLNTIRRNVEGIRELVTL